MRKSFISSFKFIEVLTENRPALIKYKYLFNGLSLLWMLNYIHLWCLGTA